MNVDFAKIAYCLSRILYNRLKSIGKYGIPINPNQTYKKLFKNNFKTFEVAGIHLFPIADIQTVHTMNFSQGICNYTEEGRALSTKRLNGDISTEINKMLLAVNDKRKNVEYHDNKISRYSMQLGKCAVTGEFLTSSDVHCHHKLPKHLGGTDAFDNLVIIHNDVHKLIHATKEETINKYKEWLQLTSNQLEKVNKFRKVCNLVALV